jgi:hypothetical protein
MNNLVKYFGLKMEVNHMNLNKLKGSKLSIIE